ncbi:MAG: SHOCT domain-containing protein [ANME-2 cluster archaeon]|nr:SHOCT domain-containing protein [ANME-2 cluster archaeon]
MMDGYGFGSGLGYGYMGQGLIFWILLILLILLIKWLVDPGKTKSGGEQQSSMEILKSRYVRGEITAEEFEEMKKRLM